MRTEARGAAVLAVALLLLAGSLLPAAAAGGNVPGEVLDGYDWCDKFEWDDESDAYDHERGPGFVTITSGDGDGGEFDSTRPVSIVFVKGGPANDGGTLFEPPVTTGTFSNDGLPGPRCDRPPDISNVIFCGRWPEPVDLELLKVWQDEEGTPLSPVTDVTWSAQVRYGNWDATGIVISGSTVSDTGQFGVHRTHYRVIERARDGFTEVECSDATRARVSSAYAAGRSVSFDGTGLFTAPETDTLHVICNSPDQPEEPELELLKVWQGEDGQPLSPLTDIEWSAAVVYGNGDPTDIEIDETDISGTGVFPSNRTSYRVVEPDDEAFVEVDCSRATMARVQAAYADGRPVNDSGTNDGVRIAAPTEDTLHVICNTPTTFHIDVDKVVTGDTAPTDGDFEMCIAGFHEREPVTSQLRAADNGDPLAPFEPTCVTIGPGEQHRFDGLLPDDYLVWERDADPEPRSVTYSGDGMPAPEEMEGVVVELREDSRTAAVTVTNRYPDIPQRTVRYYLDFEKTWTLDEVSGRLSDLTTEGYDAAFEVLDADDVAVPVTIDDVTLSAGGQSVADGARRTVSLNRDYLLEESIPALAEDLLCSIETTYSYDGEVLVPDADGDVVFTTPTSAANGTTFTIDVENEVVCDAVLGEVFETVDIEAAKSWFQTSEDGLTALDEAPEGAAPSYEVVVEDADAEVVLVEELDAGDTVTVDELEDGATYRVTWEEIEPLEGFDLDGATCTWNEEESEFVGSATFVAGDVDTVSFTGVNVYDCIEVLDTVVTPVATPTAAVLPQTGAPSLWLTLIGLLGVGLGAVMLSRRHGTR